jgi:PIN domain nuclease of toxin-antitoxin system
MDPFADPSDVAAIWRPLTDAESVVVAARIMQASRLLRRKVQQFTGSSLDALIAGGPITAADVTDVVADMVHRALTMKPFVKQQSTTVDDATISVTFDSSVSDQGGVFITDEEVFDLLGPVRSGAFEITLTDY